VPYDVCEGISLKIHGKLIVKKKSAFQEIVIIENDVFGRIMLLGPDEDSLIVQFSEMDESLYHEALVHPALALHEDPKKVLIIGGGDGGVAREVLKHGVEQVTLVDIDEMVVEVSKAYIPIHQGALDDPRVRVVIGDGKRFVEETDEVFDVIILDLTDSDDPRQPLCTEEFYLKVKDRLSEGGVLVLQSSSPTFDKEIVAHIRAVLPRVFSTVVPYSAFIPSFFLQESFCLATDGTIRDIGPVLQEREITLGAYTPDRLNGLIASPDPYWQ